MFLKINLLIVFLIFPFYTNASFYSGFEIKTRLEGWGKLTDENAISSSMGAGYVVGIADQGNGLFFCMPEGVTVGQLVSMSLKYLNENPEMLNKAADILITKNLRNVWPCQNSVENSTGEASSTSSGSIDATPNKVKKLKPKSVKPKSSEASPF